MAAIYSAQRVGSAAVFGASYTEGVADTTAPTLTGSLTVGTVTATSIQVTWPAGADNVAVTSYETSPDGSTWTDRGAGLAYTFAGLTASTSYTLRVRAKDAAGNVSTPALSVTQATAAAIGGPEPDPAITTEAFRDYSGALLALTTLPHVMVINPATRAVVLSLGGQATAADGTLTVSDAAMVAGTAYLVLAFSANGATRGAKSYMAA